MIHMDFGQEKLSRIAKIHMDLGTKIQMNHCNP